MFHLEKPLTNGTNDMSEMVNIVNDPILFKFHQLMVKAFIMLLKDLGIVF